LLRWSSAGSGDGRNKEKMKQKHFVKVIYYMQWLVIFIVEDINRTFSLHEKNTIFSSSYLLFSVWLPRTSNTACELVDDCGKFLE